MREAICPKCGSLAEEDFGGEYVCKMCGKVFIPDDEEDTKRCPRCHRKVERDYHGSYSCSCGCVFEKDGHIVS